MPEPVRKKPRQLFPIPPWLTAPGEGFIAPWRSVYSTPGGWSTTPPPSMLPMGVPQPITGMAVLSPSVYGARAQEAVRQLYENERITPEEATNYLQLIQRTVDTKTVGADSPFYEYAAKFSEPEYIRQQALQKADMEMREKARVAAIESRVRTQTAVNTADWMNAQTRAQYPNFVSGIKSTFAETAPQAEAQRQWSQFVNDLKKDFRDAIKEADTPEEVYAILQQAREGVLNAAPNEEIAGQQIMGLQFRANTKANRLKAQQGYTLQGQYPDWYQKFLQSVNPADTYVSEPAMAQWFNRWAKDNPEFQSAMQSEQAKQLEKFPTLYPAYQQLNPAIPFKQAIQEIPQLKAYYMRRRAVEETPSPKRIPNWMTPRVV